MSRDSLLYLDDLIAACEKIVRLTAARDLAAWQADEAAVDAVMFNLLVVGEAIKRLPGNVLVMLSTEYRSGPARLRDLIAHRYFALDNSIVWDVALQHVPALLKEASMARFRLDGSGATTPADPSSE